MSKLKAIKKYIDNAYVYLDIKSNNKEDALKEILLDLKKKGINLDTNNIITNIYKKEGISSSGLGYGVAFPHTYTEDINDEMIIFATSKKGLTYNSIDNKPVHLLIMFLTPKAQSGQYLEHLSILAKVSHFAMHVVLLLEAKTEEQFKKEIITFIENI